MKSLNEKRNSRVQWHSPITTMLSRLRQEDQEFKANIRRPCKRERKREKKGREGKEEENKRYKQYKPIITGNKNWANSKL
jgi:hypothetical protein